MAKFLFQLLLLPIIFYNNSAFGKTFFPSFDFKYYDNIYKDSVDYKVVVFGDSNTAGNKNIGEILNSLPNFAVYNESEVGRTTNQMIILLEKNENLRSAIKNSTHIIVYAGGNSPEHAISGGLEKIYKSIKEINRDIGIIGIDIQTSDKKDLLDSRQNLNTEIENLKNYLDFHFETNIELDNIEYQIDGIHLTIETKKQMATILLNEIFGENIKSEEVDYLTCYYNSEIDEFCNISFSKLQQPVSIDELVFPLPDILIDSSVIQLNSAGKGTTNFKVYNNISEIFEILEGGNQTEKKGVIEIEYFDGTKSKCYESKIFTGQKWELVYVPENTTKVTGYVHINDVSNIKIFLPEFISPIENYDGIYKMPRPDYYKLIAGMNMPVDSAENYIYNKVNAWESYINSLSIEEQIKWAYWKKIYSKNVYYRANPSIYKIPEVLKNYTDTIFYSETKIDSTGNYETTQRSHKVVVVPLPDVLVMYAMMYSTFMIEKQFPGKFPSYIMNLVKLSLGNNETYQSYGIETDAGVVSTKGLINPEDVGALQLNYETANYYRNLSPDFYDQFYELNVNNRQIKYYSWLTEQMVYSYTIARSKVVIGFSDNLNFADIALKASSWHRSNLPQKHKYVQCLKSGLKLYDKYLSQFFPEDDDYSEIMNEVIRVNLQNKFSNNFLQSNQFQQVEKIVIDNKNVLSQNYPQYLKEKMLENIIDIKKYDEQMFTNYIISPEYCKPLLDNNNTRFFVDNDGHIVYTFKKDETLYQLGQNRIRKWILYHNSVVDDFDKGEKFILCAEKKNDIVILNKKFEYEELPVEISSKYSEIIYDNIRDSIDYEYFLFKEFQYLGYEIKVRVGNYTSMIEEINGLKNQFSKDMLTDTEYIKKLSKIRLNYRPIYEEDTFFVPPTDFVFSKEQNGFFVLDYYLEALNGKKSNQKDIDYMQVVLEQIRKENY